MVAIRRVFSEDPGDAELLSVGSVNIIDRKPPALPFAAGTGVLCVVGEYEKGPIKTPIEVRNAQEKLARFGSFGFVVNGIPGQGPVAQQSGGAEPWNGNGFIALEDLTVNRLVLQRVDNSAGSVQLTRLACLEYPPGPYDAEPSDTATWELDGGPGVSTITVNATAATFAGTVVPPGGIGGKTLTFDYDEQDALTVFFEDTDTVLADYIARVNARFAAPVAFDDGGNLGLTSIRRGNRARARISGGTALSDFGLPTAVVADTWTITVTGDALAATQLRVLRYVGGVLTDYDTVVVAGPVGSVGAKRDAILLALAQLGVPGFTAAASGGADITYIGDPNEILVSLTAIQGGGELTIANLPAGVALEVYGTGNVGDVDAITTAEAADIIDAAANLSAQILADGRLRVCNEATPGTGSLRGQGGAFLTAIGGDITTVADASAGADVPIPAGTRFADSVTGTVWCALSDTQSGTTGSSLDIKVRPFLDTDSAPPSSAGDVTVLLSELGDGFAVDNSAAITRLTAAQLDVRYIDAIRETVANAKPANEINHIVSARTSAAIRAELARNAREATAKGLQGRRTYTRPRLGVTQDQASADNATDRDERKQFAFPGYKKRSQAIAAVGVTGGIGFSDDGVVNLGADVQLAAFRSVIRPEQSAAEDPAGTLYGAFVGLGLEDAYDPAVEGSTKLEASNYQAFKREGITALADDREQGLGFVDDVTSVPEADTGRRPAYRRALADFINDTLLSLGQRYKGKLPTGNTSNLHRGQIVQFLLGLLSPDQPTASRIRGFDVDNITDAVNLPQLQRFSVGVTSYAPAETIVYETTVGATVQTSQETI